MNTSPDSPAPSQGSSPVSDPGSFTRREFLKTTAAAGVAAGLGSSARAADQHGILYRQFGTTGEKVSCIGLGGAHMGTQFLESDSIKIVRTALDGGINFLDNSWDYNNGASETRMGKALQDGYRDKAFLMTKIDGRTKQAAAAQIDESLRRLQTTHVDLMQFHEIIRATDPDLIFAPGGAMEAMMDAKKAGKVRYIGFTGHKSPEIHLKMLATAAARGFKFDAAQMPISVMDAHYDSFGAKVLPELNRNGIAALGMKALGFGMFLRSKTVTPIECLSYAMSQPVTVTITGCTSIDNVNQALKLATNFKPLGVDEIEAILKKTEQVAQNGQLELYKTTSDFDGTTRNPQWLGWFAKYDVRTTD